MFKKNKSDKKELQKQARETVLLFGNDNFLTLFYNILNSSNKKNDYEYERELLSLSVKIHLKILN